jgi:hypothetical protein
MSGRSLQVSNAKSYSARAVVSVALPVVAVWCRKPNGYGIDTPRAP